MKKLQYVGPHTAGIFLPGDVFVPRMGVVEVDDALGTDLLSREENGQKHWRHAPKSPRTPKHPRKKATTPPPASATAPLPAGDHEVKES